MVLLLLFLFGVAVLFGSISLRPDELSRGELKRRAASSPAYKQRLRRQVVLPSLIVMTRLGAWVSLVIFVVTATAWLGWVNGLGVSLVGAALYPVCTRSGLLSRMSTQLYGKVESQLLTAAEKAPGVWRFFYGRLPDTLGTEHHFASREELSEAIAGSAGVLNDDERRLLVNGLAFRDKKIKDIMTPRSVVQTVKKDEFIGPLVLDELHSLGHGRLPVIDDDINHVIGILHLRSLLSLDVRKSTTAEELMEPRVFFVHEDDSLQKTLNGFIKQRHHLFIVVNSQRETVGLITLEDVMEALIGRKIIDEDDVHEDLQRVAKEKSKQNNNTPHGIYL